MLVNYFVNKNLITYESVFNIDGRIELISFLENRWRKNGDISIDQCEFVFLELEAIKIAGFKKMNDEMKNAITQEPASLLTK